MTTTLVWLRRDLRLNDNPAIDWAAARGRVTCVYIHEPAESAPWEPGAASRWWLHNSLGALAAALRNVGSELVIRRGPALAVLRSLRALTQADAIVWNRLYEPTHRERDGRIKAALRDEGIEVHSFNSALLTEPWEITTQQNEPFRVFTPFWKALRPRLLNPPPLLAKTDNARFSAPLDPASADSVLSLGLLPKIQWDSGLRASWRPGEEGARAALNEFLAGPSTHYAARRDVPGELGTSRLSPHLHFGEISPQQIVRALKDRAEINLEYPWPPTAESFVRELAWREFAYHILYNFPHTPESPYDPRFAEFTWRALSPAQWQAWQRGQTGFPLVDAGMRELWTTGWMHNRVRMVVASLLTKNLLGSWLEGARWFWDTLVDADLANNTLGWQWTAGCGVDAAPYFRIFNPILQGQKFDPNGSYVRRWVPELQRVPDAYLHQPWTASPDLLADAGVTLGQSYPLPIVDLAESRRAALSAFERARTVEPA